MLICVSGAARERDAEVSARVCAEGHLRCVGLQETVMLLEQRLIAMGQHDFVRMVTQSVEARPVTLDTNQTGVEEAVVGDAEGTTADSNAGGGA